MSEDTNKDIHFLEQKMLGQEPLFAFWFKAAVWFLLLQPNFRFKPRRQTCQNSRPSNSI